MKDKQDEESKALLSKLKFIFGLTSENQYEVAVASAQKEEDRVRQEETKIAQKNLDEELKKKNLERASKQIPFKKKMNLQCLIIVNNTPQVYQYQLDGSTVWFKGAKFELGVAQFDSILRDNELLITRENNIV